jgi:hypothetical protein
MISVVLATLLKIDLAYDSVISAANPQPQLGLGDLFGSKPDADQEEIDCRKLVPPCPSGDQPATSTPDTATALAKIRGISASTTTAYKKWMTGGYDHPATGTPTMATPTSAPTKVTLPPAKAPTVQTEPPSPIPPTPHPTAEWDRVTGRPEIDDPSGSFEAPDFEHGDLKSVSNFFS